MALLKNLALILVTIMIMPVFYDIATTEPIAKLELAEEEVQNEVLANVSSLDTFYDLGNVVVHNGTDTWVFVRKTYISSSFAGFTFSANKNGAFLKLDTSGSIIAQYEIESYFLVRNMNLDTDSNGNLIASGTDSVRKGRLWKIFSNGTLDWERSWAGGSNDAEIVHTSGKFNSNDELIVITCAKIRNSRNTFSIYTSGTIYIYGDDTTRLCHLAKWQDNALTPWVKYVVYNNSNPGYILEFDFLHLDSGDSVLSFAITGKLYYDGDKIIDGSSGDSLVTVGINRTGSQIWNRTFIGSLIHPGMVALNNSDVMLSMMGQGNISDQTNLQINGLGFIRLSNSGQTIWKKTNTGYMDDYAMFGSPVMNSKGITSVIITTKSFTGWQLGNFSTNITNNSNDFISLIVDIDLNGNWTDLHTFLIPNTPTNSYLPMQFATLGVLTNDTIIMAYHTNDDMTIIDGINHFNLPQHLTEVGSVSVITRLGHDADNDSILDHLDNCISITNTLQLDRDGDNIGDECELDDDDDGVIDTLDDCPRGDIDWTSNSTSDHDSDGCKDSSEDNDDDNDGIVDTIDDCPTGLLNWTSTQNNDYDGDGCEDSQEDLDDDNDLVADLDDNCIFTANPSQNNYDLDTFGDACDEDDDNDTIIDFVDDCPTGEIGWNSSIETDRDGDGCRDESEDLDDDNDLVLDDIDDCKDSITMGWTTGGSQDHDMDGCRDSDQDDDDDNDGIEDSADDCPRGDLNWISSPTTDTDGDGCQDSSEDGDDDNDKVQDDSDSCTIGGLEWESSPSTDYDSDGCEDSTQDDDDDNDQVLDLIDDCPKGQIGWNGSNPLEDRDGDGCEDSTEDDDDDNDGFNDDEDNCIITWGNTTVAPYIGCPDSDGDGVSDSQDALPFDPDYTRDDDNDGFGDDGENPDDCPTKQGTSTRDRIGCIDSDGDGYSDADSIWSVEMGADRFPQDKSKWSDSDQDGYADQFEDLCKNIFGNSSEDRLGCPDSDGDGYSDSDDSWAISAGADAFSDDSTQWVSRDGDRFGDNPNGTTPDTCPDEFGNSERNSIYGCPDRDGDYVDDVSDIFIDDPLQWSDADGDGYSDQRNSANYDDCQLTFGTSTKGEKGCSDRDGDGWSDWTDVAPDDIKVWQKSQISETPWLLIISIIVIISLSTILIIRKKRKSIID